MASIDSSSSSSANDRSSSTDETRRVRESYQQKEAETAKKQGQQIRRLTEAHQAEVEALKDQHTREVEDMKGKTRDLVSRRDMQYQKEIDDIRDMHQKQVQRLASDSQDRLARTETGLKDELQQTERTTDTQKKLMQTNYEDQLKGRDMALDEFSSRARDGQQRATQHQAEVMNKVNDEKYRVLSKDRDERVADLQRSLDVNRRAKDSEIKRLQHQQQLDIDRLGSKDKITLSEERENSGLMLEQQREALNHGMKETREKFGVEGERQRAEMEKARDELYDKVSQRVDNEVNVLQAKGTRLEGDQSRQRIKTERETARQLSDLRDNMQANIEHLEQARTDTVEMASRRTHHDIDTVNKSNAQLMHGQNQFYQDKIAMDTLRGDERFDNARLEDQKTLAQTKTSSDNRYEKLRGSNDIEQAKMRNYFERAAAQMKENFDNTLRDMRDRNKRDQDGLFSQFAKQAQDNDTKFQTKLTDLNNKYERQIAELNEGRIKDIKDEKEVGTRQKTEVAKKADLDIRAQAAQYEYRIGKIEEQHRKEIDSINRRHEETLANLTKSRQG